VVAGFGESVWTARIVRSKGFRWKRRHGLKSGLVLELVLERAVKPHGLRREEVAMVGAWRRAGVKRGELGEESLWGRVRVRGVWWLLDELFGWNQGATPTRGEIESIDLGAVARAVRHAMLLSCSYPIRFYRFLAVGCCFDS
jgi:hypothetical protein